MNYLISKIHKSRNQSIINFVIILLMACKFNFAFATSEKEIVENIKSYIQNIQSVAINFEQSDTQGTKATGILVINWVQL